MPRIRLTPEWSFEIDADFKRRIENEDLVYWRPAQTVWIAIYDVDDESEATLAWLKEDSHPNPVQVFEITEGNLLKYAYLLANEDGDKRSWGLTTFCVTKSSYVLIAYYFDDEKMLDWALSCWKSIEWQE